MPVSFGIAKEDVMERKYIRTLGEAKAILPSLEIIRIALALKQGNTVTVVDEQKGIEYVFEPKKESENCERQN